MQPKDAKEVITGHDQQCVAAVSAFKRDLQKMRTNRASASLLEGIHVDYYGSKTPLPHLGQISSPEARLLIVQVYDGSAVSAVEKAIRSSDLGFNPSREGNTLRIAVPALNEESRRDVVRHLHKMAEEMRVSIRNHRRDSNDILKKMEKEGLITQDESKKSLDKIQRQTDGHISEIDKALAAKEAECMEV